MDLPLLLLAAAAAALSGYALKGGFRPAPCASEESCQNAFTRPEARLLGVPNAALGLCYAIGVAAFALLGAAAPSPFRWAIITASVLSIGFGAYLGWILFRERLHCPICIASHIVNAGILLMLLLGS